MAHGEARFPSLRMAFSRILPQRQSRCRTSHYHGTLRGIEMMVERASRHDRHQPLSLRLWRDVVLLQPCRRLQTWSPRFQNNEAKKVVNANRRLEEEKERMQAGQGQAVTTVPAFGARCRSADHPELVR